MNDVTMERRLRLVKQIRARYSEDRSDLANRERILYGRSSRPAEDYLLSQYGESEDMPAVSFLRVRLVLAVLLAAAVIAMDRNGTEIAGITSEQIFRAISADYETRINEWLEQM